MNTFVSAMVSNMKAKYDKYWREMEKIKHFIYFRVIFDPRFKFDYNE